MSCAVGDYEFAKLRLRPCIADLYRAALCDLLNNTAVLRHISFSFMWETRLLATGRLVSRTWATLPPCRRRLLTPRARRAPMLPSVGARWRRSSTWIRRSFVKRCEGQSRSMLSTTTESNKQDPTSLTSAALTVVISVSNLRSTTRRQQAYNRLQTLAQSPTFAWR